MLSMCVARQSSDASQIAHRGLQNA